MPQTFLLDVHNPTRKTARFQVELRASVERLDLSLVASRPGLLGNEGAKIVEGNLERVAMDGLERELERHWGSWREALEERLRTHAERVGRWAEIDHQTSRWAMHKLAKLSALDLDLYYVTNGRPRDRCWSRSRPASF